MKVLKGHVISIVERTFSPEATYDFFIESWFDSPESMEEFLDRIVTEELQVEAKAFCQPLAELMVVEYPLVIPPTRQKGIEERRKENL